MVAYYKKVNEPINLKEFLKRYQWIGIIIVVLQLWAIYRKAESWLFFALAMGLFVVGACLRIFNNSNFFFKVCMLLSVCTMLFQLYAVPGNFRTDSVSVLYGDDGVWYGTKITDTELVEQITDCIKEVNVSGPLHSLSYDMNKGLLIEINGITYELYGIDDSFDNHCGIYLFNKYELMSCHYIPAEVNVELNQLIREAEPDVSISVEGDTNIEKEMNLKRMIDILELDFDYEKLKNFVGVM